MPVLGAPLVAPALVYHPAPYHAHSFSSWSTIPSRQTLACAGHVQHAPYLLSLILEEVIPVNQRQVHLALLSICLMILAMNSIVEPVPGYVELVQVLVPDLLILLVIIKHLCFSLELIGLVERA